MKVNELISTLSNLEEFRIGFYKSDDEKEIANTSNYDLISNVFENYEVINWGIANKTEPFGPSFKLAIYIKDWMDETGGNENWEPKTPIFDAAEYAEKMKNLFRSQDPSDHDNDDIRNLKLTRRAFNCLHRAGIQSIGDLREFTGNELLAIDRFGKHSLREVQDELKAYGLHLKED
jgi:hypothetical protein